MNAEDSLAGPCIDSALYPRFGMKEIKVMRKLQLPMVILLLLAIGVEPPIRAPGRKKVDQDRRSFQVHKIELFTLQCRCTKCWGRIVTGWQKIACLISANRHERGDEQHCLGEQD